MEREVLEFRTLHEIHQYLIDRLNTIERKREENSQVRVANNFHVETELVRYENLEDLFNFCVIKNAHLDIF